MRQSHPNKPNRAGVGPRLEHLEPRDVPAVAGTLDPTFGSGGVASGPSAAGGAAVVVDPLGRVVVAGSIAGPGGHDFLVRRLNPDGSPDATFGTAGTVTIDFAGGDDGAAGVVLDPTGRIVVAGTTTTGGVGQFAVARLTPAGAPDGGFGTGGTTTFHIAAGASDTATGVAVDPSDSGVVVGGYTSIGGVARFAVARLTAVGAADAAFAGGGVTSFPVRGVTTERAFAVTIDSSRRVVLAGFTFGGAPITMQAAVVRLTPAGGPDASFAGGGSAPLAINSAADVTTDPAGNVYVTGYQFAFATNMGVAKLTPAGVPDPTFAGGGTVFYSSLGPGLSHSITGAGIVVQGDGKVLAAGTDSSGGGGTVFRLTPTGQPDTTFNPAGMNPGRSVVSAVPTLAGIALAPDGRIVVAGSSLDEVRVARLIAVTAFAPLIVSGPPTGAAALFPTNPTTGQYPTAASTTLSAFPAFAGVVRAATGDVNGDTIPDTILVTGPGAPVRFAVVSGADNTTVLLPPTAAFAGSESFVGGGYVAAGDLDGDGRAEVVVTPDEGGGPRVVIFSIAPGGAATMRASFLGIDDANFRGGARVALGDVDRDGTPDLVVAAGFLGGPRTAIFRGESVLAGTPARLVGDFFAFPGTDATTLRNGSFVAAGDVTGDGFADLIFGGGPGGAPRVFIMSGALVSAGDVAGAQAAPVANFFVGGNSTDRGGVRVAAADADGDPRAEVVTGSGEGSASRVRVYLGKNVTSAAEPVAFQDLDPYGATLPGGVFVG